MNNLKFGIIQGRLTESPPDCLQWFPQDEWADEFVKASSLGINFIELIAEINHNPNNPIWTDEGINQVKKLSLDNNSERILVLYSFEHDEGTIKLSLQYAPD